MATRKGAGVAHWLGMGLGGLSARSPAALEVAKEEYLMTPPDPHRSNPNALGSNALEHRELWYVIWRAIRMIERAIDRMYHFSGVTKAE